MSEDNMHFRHIILYEFRRGSNVPVAFKNILEAYPDDGPSIVTIKRWFAKFRRGDFDLSNKAKSGRLSNISDDFVDKILKENPRISTLEVAVKLNCNISTAFRHIKKLGYVSKLDVWIPHLLSEKNKIDRLENCNSLLKRLAIDPFLDRLVTGDEKWIQYDNNRRKRSWKLPGDIPEATPKAGLHPKKVLLSIWWDCKGVIFYSLLSSNKTINSELYCNQLDELNRKIQKKRPSLANRKGIVFHQDNARPHISKQTKQKLKELNWDLLNHPPYSPDLAPSDFYLFRSLENNLAGRRFTSLEEIQDQLSTFFNSKPAEFYNKGIQMLPDRWKQVIVNEGNYIID